MKIELLDFKELKDFPSGSGIEYFDERIFLAGDDAKELLVLSKKWKKLASVPLFNAAETRIPKKIKADLEATTIVEINKIPRLLVLGSGSKETRNKAILVNLDSYVKEEFDITVFYNRLAGLLPVVNIESAAVILGKLILGNRGNKTNPDNHFIVTDIDFWKHQDQVEIMIGKLDMPKTLKQPAGLSGMTYSHQNDWLLATMSTEDTGNAVDDGAVGDSYLVIIENASRKVSRKRMNINEIINLREAIKAFKGYKIESVCIQSEKSGRAKIQLIADNDTGATYLFKVRVKG